MGKSSPRKKREMGAEKIVEEVIMCENCLKIKDIKPEIQELQVGQLLDMDLGTKGKSLKESEKKHNLHVKEQEEGLKQTSRGKLCQPGDQGGTPTLKVQQKKNRFMYGIKISVKIQANYFFRPEKRQKKSWQQTWMKRNFR